MPLDPIPGGEMTIENGSWAARVTPDPGKTDIGKVSATWTETDSDFNCTFAPKSRLKFTAANRNAFKAAAIAYRDRKRADWERGQNLSESLTDFMNQ